jgi:hypothetical protein
MKKQRFNPHRTWILHWKVDWNLKGMNFPAAEKESYHHLIFLELNNQNKSAMLH